MIKRSFLFYLLSLFFACSGLAQEQSAEPDDLLLQLQQAYNAFDMQKSTELLNIALNSLDSFTADERVEIFKYAAFIAFQNGANTLAANHFWRLLSVDPTYTLDPVTTPPKALALFQKTKIEYLEDLNKRLQTLQNSSESDAVLNRRFLVPGWEQWHRGYKGKGGALAATAGLSLGGLVFAVYQTGQSRAAYRNEQNPDAIPPLYSQYNRYYKMQYTFGYLFAVVWALSQVDLILWSPPRMQATISPKLGRSPLAFGVQLSLHRQ